MRPLHSRRRRATLLDAHEFRRRGVGDGIEAADYIKDAEHARIIEEVEEHLFNVGREHFPRTANLEYAVLKTHLIIENALTQYIRCTSCVLIEPESLRFSFAEKLEIAILRGFGHGSATTVPSIELLNRLRNQVAHRLSFDMQLVNELIRINTEDLDARKLTDRQRIACIRKWCYFICGMIVGELKMGIALTQGDLPRAV